MCNYKKIFRNIFCVIMALFLFACNAFASVEKETGTLKISYLVKDEPVEDVTFDIFHVASFGKKSELIWDWKYEDYRLKLDLDDEERLGTMANTLSGYIKRDHISASGTNDTNSKGIVCFDNLKRGLYLVVGHQYEADSLMYTPVPTFVQVTAHLPTELQIKYERTILQEETTERRVLKSWNDEGIHPDSITVQLLKNGEIFHSIKLSKSNNWRYEWTDLDANTSWTIVEAYVPTGYVMQTEQTGSTTVITNSKLQTPPVVSDPPQQPQQPQPTPTPEKNIATPKPVKLPQTGLLWWPVFLMAGIGILFLILDLIRRREDWIEWKSIVTRRKPFFLYLGTLLILAVLALTCHNLMEDKKAGETANRTLYDLRNEIQESGAADRETPDYLLSPNMDMPQVELDGSTYIGTVSIPSFSIELPIISECTPANLKAAPCLYKGSAYEDKLIIAGHNYTSHFGVLPNLKESDDVIIPDIDGNTFSYKVANTEVIDGTDAAAMEDGDWNLTLFTCTRDGRSRVAVRCKNTEK